MPIPHTNELGAAIVAATSTTGHTLDAAVNALYKFKLITKRSRKVIGEALFRELRAVRGYSALGNGSYSFHPFDRKMKRVAIHDTLTAVLLILTQNDADQDLDDGTSLAGMLNIARNKNAERAGYIATTEYDDETDTYRTVRTAAAAMEADRANVSLGERFNDMTDDQRDPDTEDYANSAMVRPIAVIEAERAERAERIRLERMAEAAERATAAELGDDADDDDDDWDLDDDDL